MCIVLDVARIVPLLSNRGERDDVASYLCDKKQYVFGCREAVTVADFEEALEEEPSDYDAEVAKRNREFNKKHGWRRKC